MGPRQVRLGTGVTLAVDEVGPATGVPAVLVPAWGETHGTFEAVVPLLPPSLRLVLPDLRGTGASEKPPSGYSVPELAADLVALLDALDVDAAWFVGTSSGGYVAQQVAVSAPDRCRGLVLIGSPRSLHGRGDPFRGLLASLSDPLSAADLERLVAATPTRAPVPADFLARRTADGGTIPTPVWRATFEGLVAARPPTEQDVVRTGGPHALPPALVLWGAEDDLLPREDADALVAAFPGSRLTLYEGTGHPVLWEQPARVAADVAAWVAEHEPAAGTA